MVEKQSLLKSTLTFSALFISSSVAALPEGGVVTGGQAALTSSANALTINQSSPLASFQYDSFNIAAGETVNFIQPGVNSIALNQINGGSVSEIFGSLNANGQVFLINPNGILFAPGSQVNVGGLLASTLNITNEDFFNQQFKFDSNGTNTSIQNYGQLQGGYIALVSPQIENHGDITADNINLHAADSVLVSFSPTIHIETLSSTYDATIENKGLISANGGEVVLTVASHNALLETAINNEGVIEAGSLVEKEGRVFLIAEDQGDVINSGEITVSAIESNSHGGEILLDAKRVAQLGDIYADGLGQGDGGQVHLYGSDVVALARDSVTTANAGDIGNGGEIIALSPNTTLFRQAAVIEATGGDLAGDGGYVDVSGWQHVEVFGNVNVASVEGDHGTFLIDPINLTITGADFNSTESPADTFIPTATGATLSVGTLNAAVTGGANVEVRTDVAGAEAGDLTIDGVSIDFDGNGGGSLLLFASGDIIFNANSQIIDGTPGDDPMDITLTAGGDITFFDNTLIQTYGGNFVANAAGLFRVDPSSIGGDSLIDAGSGTISITTGGNMRVGGLLSTNATSSAIILNIGGDITDAGNAHVDIVATNGRTDITANGSLGIETTMSELVFNFTTGSANITNSSALNVISGSAASDLTITTSAGNLDISGSIDTDSALGSTYTFNANQALNINAGANIGDQSGADDNVNMVLNAGTTLTMQDTSSINALGGTITATTTAGDMTVTNLVSTSASATAIDLNVTGDLLDGGDTDLRDLDAINGGISLNITGNVETPGNLEIEADRLNLNLSGGNVNISELSGIDITGSTGVGILNLDTVSGDITVSGNIDLDGSNGNTYMLNAAQDIIVNAGVSIADLTTGTIDDTALTLTAGRHVTMEDTSVIDTTAGAINITATNNVQLSSLQTTNNSANAVDISAVNITDGGDTNIDIVANSGQVNLTASGSVGDADAIETDVNQISFNMTSSGNARINESNDVEITSVTTVTDFEVIASSGNIVLQDAGLIVNGTLAFSAQDLLDVSGRVVDIAAVDAYFNLTNLALDTEISGFIDRVDLNAGGAGNLTFVNYGASNLELFDSAFDADSNSLTFNGNDVTIRTTGGVFDIIISDDIDLDGTNAGTLLLDAANDVVFATDVTIEDQTTASVDSTNVIITAANDVTMLDSNVVNTTAGTINIASTNNVQLGSLQSTNNSANAIDITAVNITDAGDTNIDIVANNGQVNLTASGSIGDLNALETDVNQLSLNLTGNGNARINESNDIELTSVTTAAELEVVASTGTITIADAGINVSGDLILNAQDLVDADRTVVLAAQNLNLNLSAAAGDVAINSTLTSLDATMSGVNRNLTITETDDIIINSLAGINDFNLIAAAGTVTIPDAGLNISGNLNVITEDVIDSDRTINFTATNLLLDITAAAGDMAINTSVDRINADFTGASGSTDLSITESNGLEVIDLGVNPPNALANADGNISVQVSSGDLIINDGISASDLTADGARSGMIDLSVDSGDILIGNLRATTISSNNLVDQSASGGLDGNQVAVLIHNPDAGDLDTDIIIGDGSGNDVSIVVEGGDFEIDNSTNVGLTGGNTRDTIISSDVTVDVYNNIADPLTGTTVLQGVTNNGTVNVHAGRDASVISGEPVVVVIDEAEIENEIANITQGESENEAESVADTPASSQANQSPAQQVFNEVFRSCDQSSGQYSKAQCAVEMELQKFLQSLLIGGQLPKVGNN